MYDDMARAVGAHLNCDPYMIQFFKPQGKLTYTVCEHCCIDLCGLAHNKAGYTATEVACGWAGAIFEATASFGQEQ